MIFGLFGPLFLLSPLNSNVPDGGFLSLISLFDSLSSSPSSPRPFRCCWKRNYVWVIRGVIFIVTTQLKCPRWRFHITDFIVGFKNLGWDIVLCFWIRTNARTNTFLSFRAGAIAVLNSARSIFLSRSVLDSCECGGEEKLLVAVFDLANFTAGFE